MAFALAADNFKETEPEEHTAEHNQVGALESPNLEKMSEGQLRAMHDEIIHALRARGHLSAPTTCVDTNAGETLEGTEIGKVRAPGGSHTNYNKMTTQRQNIKTHNTKHSPQWGIGATRGLAKPSRVHQGLLLRDGFRPSQT